MRGCAPIRHSGMSLKLWIESLGLPAVLPPQKKKRAGKSPVGAALGRTGSRTDNYKLNGPLANDNNLWIGHVPGLGTFQAKEA